MMKKNSESLEEEENISDSFVTGSSERQGKKVKKKKRNETKRCENFVQKS
jgi:hypothetical protein